MPYIKQERRHMFNDIIEVLARDANNSGDINYIITTLINKWLHKSIFCYGSLNTVIGILECAKLELYRRMVVPYENKKKKENGDVY